MEDYRKIEPSHKKDPYEADRDDPYRYMLDMTINNGNKPVKYRRPWKDSFKEAAASFAVGLAFITALGIFLGLIVGAITLVAEVSWLFIFPIAAIIFIIMVLVKRFDP